MMRLLLSVAFLAMVFIAPTAVFAEEDKFAYVDVSRALARSDAYKKAQAIVNKKLVTIQKEVDDMEADIKKVKAELEAKGSLITREARAELEEKLQNKIRAFRRLVEDNQSALDRENKRWNKKLNRTLGKVIEEMVKEKGYLAVFGKGQVLFANEAINITDQVIERLNARTKKGM